MGNLLKRLAEEIARYIKPIIFIDINVLNRVHHHKPATHIQVSIPIHHITLFRNQLNLTSMATQFGKAFKAPYKLTADGDGVINNPVFSGASFTKIVPDDSNGLTGFIFGVNDGVDSLVVNGINSAGSTISGSVVITISDAPPPNPATSIGITVGDAVPQ